MKYWSARGGPTSCGKHGTTLARKSTTSCPGLPPERLRWAQAVIQRQVKHMSWLLDDLLDVARITQCKLELKKGRVSLTSIVDAAVEAARPLLDEKRHHLIVDLPPEVPTLEAHPLRLAQVVSNLLNNAAKYTDSGGRIELSARVAMHTPLPALDMDAAQTAPPDAVPSDATGRRVLIADDNKDAADSLAMLLEIDGHEVRVAHSGHAALALAQVFRPEVVLLDIGMPELSYYEVATALRKEPWGKEMQLIALTGWGQESDRRRTKSAGFDWHLTKPIDIDTLYTVLRDRRVADVWPEVRPCRFEAT